MEVSNLLLSTKEDEIAYKTELLQIRTEALEELLAFQDNDISSKLYESEIETEFHKAQQLELINRYNVNLESFNLL
jgi:hypothetical protein